MRNNQPAKKTFKVLLEGAKEQISLHWDKILAAVRSYASIIQFDRETGIFTVASDANQFSLAGRLKDALRSVHFGLDVSVSKA